MRPGEILRMWLEDRAEALFIAADKAEDAYPEGPLAAVGATAAATYRKAAKVLLDAIPRYPDEV